MVGVIKRYIQIQALLVRERQRASVDVKRVVEVQSGLREWGVRESDG